MYISELIFEITRRCNMSCDHCLRGAPQNVNISNETIDKALEGVTSIGMITFTGGEPTLAVDRIEYIYRQIKKRGVSLGGFYVITNGMIASKRLVHVLIDLYAYLEYHDEYSSVLTISKDQYHDHAIKFRQKAEELYKALSFYAPDYRDQRIEMPINEGQAYQNGLGTRDVSMSDLAIEYDDNDKVDRIDGTVYVNALGDVIPSCDMSFESQEENKIGNVHKRTLAEIALLEVQKLAVAA